MPNKIEYEIALFSETHYNCFEVSQLIRDIKNITRKMGCKASTFAFKENIIKLSP